MAGVGHKRKKTKVKTTNRGRIRAAAVEIYTAINSSVGGGVGGSSSSSSINSVNTPKKRKATGTLQDTTNCSANRADNAGTELKLTQRQKESFSKFCISFGEETVEEDDSLTKEGVVSKTAELIGWLLELRKRGSGALSNWQQRGTLTHNNHLQPRLQQSVHQRGHRLEELPLLLPKNPFKMLLILISMLSFVRLTIWNEE